MKTNESNLLMYTFRTYPSIEQLREIFSDVFIFGKLKDDLEDIKQRIRDSRPEYIIGIAHSEKPTVFEPIAINKFNAGSISRSGGSQLRLSELAGIRPSQKPTTTFCNWTMYKLQEFLNETIPETKLIFLHLNDGDLDRLNGLLQGMDK